MLPVVRETWPPASAGNNSTVLSAARAIAPVKNIVAPWDTRSYSTNSVRVEQRSDAKSYQWWGIGTRKKKQRGSADRDHWVCRAASLSSNNQGNNGSCKR